MISNNKISAPIGLQEVYSLLGVSKTGTYYDVAYICGNAHGRINPWSDLPKSGQSTSRPDTIHRTEEITGGGQTTGCAVSAECHFTTR